MPEHAGPEAPLPTARRSRKLAVTMITLLLLPFILPVPLAYGEFLWIYPMATEQRRQCTSFPCPAAINGDRLGWLVVLGPSILLLLTALFLGTIGLVRARRCPTLPEKMEWYQLGVVIGTVLTLLFGCILWVGLLYAGTTL